MASTPFFFFFLGIILCLVWFTTDVQSEKVLFGSKGSSVVLSPGDTESSIISITWKHGTDLAAEWFGGDPTFYRIFNDGCSLNTKTGELTINDVRPEHGGVYTPEINGQILSAIKLRVFSPVPKPRITHDCDPEQTKCTLTCSFDRTDDLGDVEVFWILDDRREKSTEIQITKETKEETFICSLKNPVSSQNSTELKNPLLPKGRRHYYLLILLVLPLIVLGLFLIFHFKIHQRILRFIRGRNEQRSSAEGRRNKRSPTIITPPERQSLLNGSPAGRDAVQPESNLPGSAENPSPSPSSETKPDPESNTSNRQGPAETPDPVSASETKPELEPNTTNMEEITENQNSAPSLDSKPDPESNTSKTQEPAESPAPSSDSNPDPDPETNKEAEDQNPDPPEEDNHETDSGSAENDLPEAERPEDSSGSPGGTVSTSEPS